jgi:ATP-dependent exoDNAse (exonuclease V) alpha subunit
VFLAGLYRAEREIAGKLNVLAAGKPPWPLIDGDRAIPWVEKRTKLALAESQIEAVRAALALKVLVITGGPGVGKTTLVNSILKILLAKTDRPPRANAEGSHTTSGRLGREDQAMPSLISERSIGNQSREPQILNQFSVRGESIR